MQFDIIRRTGGFATMQIDHPTLARHNQSAMEKQSESMEQAFGMSPQTMVQDFVTQHIGTGRSADEELERIRKSENPLALTMLAALGEKELRELLGQAAEDPEGARAAVQGGLLNEESDDDDEAAMFTPVKPFIFWGTFAPTDEVKERAQKFLDQAEALLPKADKAFQEYALDHAEEDWRFDGEGEDIINTVKCITPSPYADEVILTLNFGNELFADCTIDLATGKVTDVFAMLPEEDDDDLFDDDDDDDDLFDDFGGDLPLFRN